MAGHHIDHQLAEEYEKMVFPKISHISATLAAAMALAWGTQAYADIYTVHEVTER
jgi:hypothetical protein